MIHASLISEAPAGSTVRLMVGGDRLEVIGREKNGDVKVRTVLGLTCVVGPETYVYREESK